MQNLYSTKDFYNSAFIMANGIPLKDHTRENNVTTFYFEDSTKLQSLVKQYYSMTALIEPIQFGNTIKALKSIIYSYSTSTQNHQLNNGFSNTKLSKQA